MPELPEVETIVRQLKPAITGKKIADFWCERQRTVPTHDLSEFKNLVFGAKINDIFRRAKYIVLKVGDNSAIAIHLKMSGSLKVIDVGGEYDSKYTRAYFVFNDHSKLLFNDIRRFGRVHLIENYDKWQSQIGVEPFDLNFNSDYIKSKFINKKMPIKTALLDQTIIAGIGNIYADEILWASKIDPNRPANMITLNEVEDICKNTVQILATAIKANGSTFRNYRDLHGLKGGYMDIANCYGKTGELCKRDDGGTITRTVVRTRATHFCPVCQK